MSQSASPPKVPVQGVASPLQLVGGNVTLPASLLAVAKAATIATAQTQASGTAYGDLATVGPTVTVTTPAGGKSYAVLVKADIMRAFLSNSALLSFAVSGATTVLAGASAEGISTPGGVDYRAPLICVGVVALNEGDNTITAKYSNNGGSGNWTFLNRGIVVVPLG